MHCSRAARHRLSATPLSPATPPDVADLIERFQGDDRAAVFNLLDDRLRAGVLMELEDGFLTDVVGDLPPRSIADILGHMPPDECADQLVGLDANVGEQVFDHLQPTVRTDVHRLLRYPPETAGQTMTTEFFAMAETATVQETRDALAAYRHIDPVFYIFVTAAGSGALAGSVSLKKLISSGPQGQIGDLAMRGLVTARPEEDQEEVARKFRKYNIWVMPVVDDQQRMLGRITVDDIMDVMHKEADEDLAHIIGAPDLEEEPDSAAGIARRRLPWLMFTMFAGLINSIIISKMLNVTQVVAIAIFIPAILAMGGNTGMQSSVIAVRGIALGHEQYGRLTVIILREISVGILLGLACGTVAGIVVFAALSLSGAETAAVTPALLGATVGIAMCCAMGFASCFGGLAPILLHKAGTSIRHWRPVRS